MHLRRLFALLFALLVTAVPVFGFALAQQTNPNVNILFPPAIYSVSGSVNVVGTVNPPGLVSYFLEFRPLVDARTAADASVPWSPVTLPSRSPVIGGTLGTWDTTLTLDGLYELRLTVFTSDNQTTYARVSPVRVLNNLPPFAITPISGQQPEIITVVPVPTQAQFPTQVSPPEVQSPQVLALIDANIRTGDGTNYPAIGGLLRGQSAPVVGVSSRGTGWWLVVLPDGRQGWVAPSTVQVSGSLGAIPVVSPPATPTPTFTPTPIATATPQFPDALISTVRFDRTPKQGEPFNVSVTLFNQSSRALPRVAVACNFTPMNAFFNTFIDELGAFEQRDVTLAVTLNSGGGANITANCAVDVNNLVQELNESNNFFNLTTMLTEP